MGVVAGTLVNRTSEVFSVDPANEKCIARRENIILQSNSPDNLVSPWGKGPNTTRIGITTAPDGTNTALTYAGDGSAANIFVNQGVNLEANTVYTCSCWARLISGGPPTGGSIISATFHNGTTLTRSAVNYANNITETWQRFSTTFLNVTAQTGVSMFFLADQNNTSQIAIWGAQLERNNVMGDYVATTTAAVSRTTTITDLSSSAVAGTKKGQVGYNPYTRSGTFDFNNTTSDFIEFSRNGSIDITNNLSIETWVYPRSFVNVGGILTYGTNAGEQFALWTSNTNTIAFSTNWPTSHQIGVSQTLSTNTWYHVVATFSSGAWQIYINGVLSNSGTFAISTLPQVANAYVTLGNNHPGGQEYFNGFMGATKIYSRVLSGSEIIDKYNSTRTRYGYKTPTFELPSNAIGLTQANPASSAAAIKAAYPYAPDGVYWINLPTSGATRVYCLMDDAYDGGGWMLMMKATRGTTFNYSANYWTTDNTLNATQLNLNDDDAKYDVMNKFAAKDMMAIWPDILQNGGSLTGKRGWTWLQNDFYAGVRITPISFWNTVDRYFFGDAKLFSGWATGVFSSQTDVRFYGFNYRNDQAIGNGTRTRWGFGWNENGGGLYPNGNMGSDDVAGGIGINGVQQNTGAKYSAGEVIGCCQDNTGINRSARVELYVR